MSNTSQKFSPEGVNRLLLRSHVIRLSMQGKSLEDIENETGFIKKINGKWMSRNASFVKMLLSGDSPVRPDHRENVNGH